MDSEAVARRNLRESMLINGHVLKNPEAHMREPHTGDDRRQAPRRAEDLNRTLTDEDVDAIVARFQEVVTKQFYTDIGKGVIAACKRALIVLLIGFAAYGSWKGMK